MFNVWFYFHCNWLRRVWCILTEWTSSVCCDAVSSGNMVLPEPRLTKEGHKEFLKHRVLFMWKRGNNMSAGKQPGLKLSKDHSRAKGHCITMSHGCWASLSTAIGLCIQKFIQTNNKKHHTLHSWTLFLGIPAIGIWCIQCNAGGFPHREPVMRKVHPYYDVIMVNIVAGEWWWI